MNLDRTHITCQLTPRRKSERILKVYSIEEEKMAKVSEGSRKSTVVVPPLETELKKRIKIKEQTMLTNSSVNKSTKMLTKFIQIKNETKVITHKPQDNLKESRQNHIRKCVVRISKNLKRKSLHNSSTNTPQPSNVITSNNNNEMLVNCQEQLSKRTLYTSSQLDLSVEKEKRLPNNVSQHLNSSDSDEIAASDTENAPTPIGTKRLRRSFRLLQHRRMQKNDVIMNKHIHETTDKADNTTKSHISPTEALKIDKDDCGDIEDPHIQSFYDISFTEDQGSPRNFKELSSQTVVNILKDASTAPLITDESNTPLECCQLLEKAQNITSMPFSKKILNNTAPLVTESAPNSAKQLVQLTPLNLPPSYDEVLASCVKLGIPEYEFQKPFYGNPDDITRVKEIGHIALHIPGNLLFIQLLIYFCCINFGFSNVRKHAQRLRGIQKCSWR